VGAEVVVVVGLGLQLDAVTLAARVATTAMDFVEGILMALENKEVRKKEMGEIQI
jgi:hypothetical protein